MILSECYVTIVKAFSDSNCTEPYSGSFNIDTTAYIKVQLLDYGYHESVVNKKVTITVDRGSFINNEKTYTGYTNSDGEIVIAYHCAQFGLATFLCNESNCQIMVKGWKTHGTPYTNGNSNARIEYNEYYARFRIYEPVGQSWTTTGANYTKISFEDTGWIHPYMPVTSHQSTVKWIVVNESNNYVYFRTTSNSTGTCYHQIDWSHRKWLCS